MFSPNAACYVPCTYCSVVCACDYGILYVDLLAWLVHTLLGPREDFKN